jgi:hypothetical protein
MAEARLLTAGSDEQSGERLVDVSHEALIRSWPQLRKWIDSDRAGLRTRTRITEAARDWKKAGGNPTYFYTGARLAVADEWNRSHPGELNEDETDFFRSTCVAVGYAGYFLFISC